MSEESVRSRAAAFCTRHGIASIALSSMGGVIAAEQVCDVLIVFGATAQAREYRVRFKLQGALAGVGEIVRSIDADGRIEYGAAPDCRQQAASGLAAFLREIEPRVARIRHEQSIQNVRFPGNSFQMGGQTVFTVIADHEGNLDIELHRGETRQRAVLLASSLLDGLYDGTIRPL